MALWHDFNPWADRLVYLPDLAELSACLDPLHAERHLIRWQAEHKSAMDAYIISAAQGRLHSCGIRYGKEGEQYYSPYINSYVAELLLAKYRNAGAP